ncbi:DEAD/DEAH box helicase [Texas Phoenix palm phytoplasma]|uniref:DEAD/DEAH box helicase n=1 Tax=Texas Phoenix palm phytoplasma TaxID=176709 RepID=A0ABS5BIF1_9MOLU|nr:DEAD/DEAH box helicase [Texas Phoenix palm phytoplasma]MBP3059363.1 DEAD/DEAH box helicase [Texas Phoenix palm phytoplasma]
MEEKLFFKIKPSQKKLAISIIKKMNYKNRCLAVAPTGSGKTVIFSKILSFLFKNNKIKKACVLCHRDEINFQNKKCFEKINPNITTVLFDSNHKNWDAQVIFAMCKTLGTDQNLLQLDSIDMMIIDEAHHSTSFVYKKIIDHFKSKNNNFKFFGFTATPEREDGEDLLNIFGEIVGEITFSEAIEEGLLVDLFKKTIVIEDKNIKDEMSILQRNGKEYDMDKTSLYVNNVPVNEEVIKNWKKYSIDRKTIIFCTNLKHVYDLTKKFKENDIKAEAITAETNNSVRKDIINDFRAGKIKVIINCQIFSEGFDEPSISCVIILRPVMYKTVFYQMIGRGLRNDHNHKKDLLIICWGNEKDIYKHIDYVLIDKKSKKRYLKEKNHDNKKKNYSCLHKERKRSELTHSAECIIKEIDIIERRMKNKLKKSNFYWYLVLKSENIKCFASQISYNNDISFWCLIFYLIKKKEYCVINGKNYKNFKVLKRDKNIINCLKEADKWLKGTYNWLKNLKKKPLQNKIKNKHFPSVFLSDLLFYLEKNIK